MYAQSTTKVSVSFDRSCSRSGVKPAANRGTRCASQTANSATNAKADRPWPATKYSPNDVECQCGASERTQSIAANVAASTDKPRPHADSTRVRRGDSACGSRGARRSNAPRPDQSAKYTTARTMNHGALK